MIVASYSGYEIQEMIIITQQRETRKILLNGEKRICKKENSREKPKGIIKLIIEKKSLNFIIYRYIVS